MGLCASVDPALAAERKAAKAIDMMLEEAMQDHQSLVKILLLGTGNSGKSTILKQFKLLFSGGFTDADYKYFRKTIQKNLMKAMKQLVEAAADFRDEVGEFPEHLGDLVASVIDEASFDWNAAFGATLGELWFCDAVQGTFKMEGKLQLEFPVEYFCSAEVLGRVAEGETYKPSKEDILQCRQRTTGVHKLDFEVEGLKFQAVDVGGQRNERKKWISQFDDVNAIMFIASLSEYNKVLLEDATTNRTVESINLFGEICACPYFLKCNVILFLNKRDLFESKINNVSLHCCFDDISEEDGKNYAKALGHLKAKYLEAHCKAMALKLKKQAKMGMGGDDEFEEEEGDVYTHVTCATDTTNVEFVFSACRDIICKDLMGAAGLL